MIRRNLPDEQLDLFPNSALYLTQADVAEYLNIPVRTIQYWETNGLLHGERPQLGRIRKYTQRDLVELTFIKTMLVEHGYSIPALKEKLKKLQSPYYYDGTNIFWDIENEDWKDRASIAADELQKIKEVLIPNLKTLFENMEGEDASKVATATLSYVKDVLLGKRQKLRSKKQVPRKRRKKEGSDTLF